MTLTVASLCSGYESTGLGLTLAGWDHRLAFVADPDPAASKVLAHHHPDVPNLGDITRVAWDGLGLTGEIDLLTAGFPCTDISCAGRRAGLAPGTRSGIWANVADAIDALRPRLVLIENVAALLSTPANRSTDGTDGDLEPGPAGLGDQSSRSVLRAIGAVCGDLATLGFDAVWQVVSAASVGAPHLRKRVFILAWPAADPPRFGHRDGGTQGIGGFPAATVAGGAQADGVSLLPTPNAALGRGTGTPSAETARRRMYDEGRRFLDDAVALLPTPAAADGERRSLTYYRGNPTLVGALLPTPTATPYGNNQSPSAGAAVRPSLNSLAAGALLPTPTVADARGSRNATAGRGADASSEWNPGWSLSDIAYADRWGDYGPAIARWEQVTGRPAPDPTEPGKNQQPRLSARFVEWLQGLPDGYVTAVPGISRNDALRLLGNSNPPQQYAAAINQLAAIVAAVTAREAAA